MISVNIVNLHVRRRRRVDGQPVESHAGVLTLGVGAASRIEVVVAAAVARSVEGSAPAGGADPKVVVARGQAGDEGVAGGHVVEVEVLETGVADVAVGEAVVGAAGPHRGLPESPVRLEVDVGLRVWVTELVGDVDGHGPGAGRRRLELDVDKSRGRADGGADDVVRADRVGRAVAGYGLVDEAGIADAVVAAAAERGRVVGDAGQQAVKLEGAVLVGLRAAEVVLSVVVLVRESPDEVQSRVRYAVDPVRVRQDSRVAEVPALAALLGLADVRDRRRGVVQVEGHGCSRQPGERDIGRLRPIQNGVESRNHVRVSVGVGGGHVIKMKESEAGPVGRRHRILHGAAARLKRELAENQGEGLGAADGNVDLAQARRRGQGDSDGRGRRGRVGRQSRGIIIELGGEARSVALGGGEDRVEVRVVEGVAGAGAEAGDPRRGDGDLGGDGIGIAVVEEDRDDAGLKRSAALIDDGDSERRVVRGRGRGMRQRAARRGGTRRRGARRRGVSRQRSRIRRERRGARQNQD